ncbi:Protein of unknown function YugN-like [Paenibacillus curdlanolyticus YK9]|uniref:YugN-like family protein n=1 Tax=Paenibacillus curdlanolyticus YK9 TaxID=717606 RepID=E0IBF2_9BACL|nr:Protein of unknown function YugN-like [Paenibacillus curdlanolyticus YK9]
MLVIPLESDIQSREYAFVEAKERLEQQDFTLGGNWDYEKGSFDRSLDEANKVWLRLPFEVLSGAIDNLDSDNDATIRLGTPYVLKHVYNEGNDEEASVRIAGSLIDQFQSPVDPDAKIEAKWIDKAKQVLSGAEQGLLLH